MIFGVFRLFWIFGGSDAGPGTNLITSEGQAFLTADGEQVRV